ncbi:glycosyl hydrolase family 28-related protein [Maribellus sp. YY47]|uniref:glycosyl hydrolase family 28-related protein n=1 Tax=Maribellus sp. YY47 TaxID=2929486 RepID=UPI0024941B07|nr:glycosyl hydrolase family 28-related protein [Maribellus sp. YY47]
MKSIKPIGIFCLFLMLINVHDLSALGNHPSAQKESNAYYYNVKNYGAKGDARSDDTQAIQAAINAAAEKGGVVYFPNGVYNIAGPVIDSLDGLECLSQLYIPHSDKTNSKNIVFQGETAPEFELQGIVNAPPSTNGAILLSSIISDDPRHAVIAMQKGPDGSWSQWNYTTPSFKDLGVRTSTTKDSTPVINSMNGINLRYASKCYFDNVLIDTNGPLSESLDPAPGKSTGLITPEINNHALVRIGMIRIGGYACGFKFSEHMVGQDIQIVCCNVGMLSEASHHSSSIQTLEIECCCYPVVFNPGHNLFVANYNTEHFTDDKWFAFKQDITFEGSYYYPAKMVIGLCHPVVSYVGYDLSAFKTNDPDRVVLLEKREN